ncbi:hypothetical protein C8Q75DRAFT_784099 [Abortiporus biennis]|nr:hypothetical protein C8Q75DRAFT_784099 [Abortiporus biennis]
MQDYDHGSQYNPPPLKSIVRYFKADENIYSQHDWSKMDTILEELGTDYAGIQVVILLPEYPRLDRINAMSRDNEAEDIRSQMTWTQSNLNLSIQVGRQAQLSSSQPLLSTIADLPILIPPYRDPPVLSLDVQRQIIRYVDHHVTLAMCALTCRSWLSECRSHHFHYCHIYDSDHCQRLLVLLENRDHETISPHIRKLFFWDLYFTHLSNIIVKLTLMLPSVKDIILKPSISLFHPSFLSFHPSFLRAYQRIGWMRLTVTKLTLEGCTISFSELRRFLCMFHKVQHVYLYGVIFSDIHRNSATFSHIYLLPRSLAHFHLTVFEQDHFPLYRSTPLQLWMLPFNHQNAGDSHRLSSRSVDDGWKPLLSYSDGIFFSSLIDSIPTSKGVEDNRS